MGDHFSVDVSEVRMFAAYDWWDLGEPCGHTCEHRATKVVAWGPTTATYELEECCGCGCRSWRDGRYVQERQRTSGLHGFWHGQMVWSQPPTRYAPGGVPFCAGRVAVAHERTAMRGSSLTGWECPVCGEQQGGE